MMKHWTDRIRHLKRMGLTTPEGYPRPNAPQYLKRMVYRTSSLDAITSKPPYWFRAMSMFGVCYRIRCNRPFVISAAIWRRLDETRAILEVCIAQAECASVAKSQGENRVHCLP